MFVAKEDFFKTPLSPFGNKSDFLYLNLCFFLKNPCFLYKSQKSNSLRDIISNRN